MNINKICTSIMTQEDKQLLLKDLCSRLPYGVIGLYSWRNHEPYIRELRGYLLHDLQFSWGPTEGSKFLPYLRPMSSMTEEEKVEYCDLQDKFLFSSQNPVTTGYALFDWLNKKMFDYRGLIPKGHAIEVTEDNNPYKD